MAASGRGQSQRLVGAAIVGIVSIAAIGLAALNGAGPRRDGLAPDGRPGPPRRRRPRPGPEPDAVPVRPDRPLDLSGGAAAALDFDN